MLMLISHTPNVSTENFFWLIYTVYIVYPPYFLFGKSVVFGRTIKVFLDISIFSLTACHCLSAHGNKSFSICHSYLSLHLLLILHCFFPPCFSSSALIFLLFWPFFSDIRAVLDFLEGCIFYIFSAFVFFLSAPKPIYFWLEKKGFTEVRAFSWEVSVPIICDPWPLFQNAFLVPSGPPRAVEAETVNASAVRVKWRAPAPERQHGQIRGYQVHYVRMNYGEPQGQPFIKDILIEDSQVILSNNL